MATAAARASSSLDPGRQFAWAPRAGDIGAALERWLEAERDQLPLWLPVMLGGGIAAWFWWPDPRHWAAAMLVAGAGGLLSLAMGRHGRLARALGVGLLAVALGVSLAWWRAERVAAPVLARPVVVTVSGQITRVEPLPARDLVRMTLRPERATDGQGQAATLPPRVRVNLATTDVPAGLSPGATIRLQARLMPPPPPDVPGAYDYAEVAWYAGIGAIGRGSAPVTIVVPGKPASEGLRERLSRHIGAALPGSEGGIAAALATGDTGAIAETDNDAMRRAGLAHLLSVSGLHLTAVVGATMLIVLRLLALSPWLALRVRLPLIAGGAGAAAAIGYTWLTGGEVPTIRSCVAALLVLAALAVGRRATTLRSVAAGATVVMLLYPEAIVGPSFQLSFAAITAIVAFHEHPAVARWFGPHEEGRARRLGRHLVSLLATGMLVEAALLPIAVYHFHREGLYGAVANIAAIPLTTFVTMPAEALALALDTIGLGGPAWWLAGRSLAALLWIAHRTATMPGAVAMVPGMTPGAFALAVSGGLWLALWRTRARWLGLAPLLIAAGCLAATPAPDLLVTGDGRHVAVRLPDGGLALLRDKAGDYTRSVLATSAGLDGEPLLLAEQSTARCSPDLCVTDVASGRRHWRVLATRSAYPIDREQLSQACRAADVAISERALPRSCRPRWLKLDKPALARTGGVSISFANGAVTTVLQPGDRHPWRTAPVVRRSGAEAPTACPGCGPGRGRSVGDHRRGWRDRAGPSRPRVGNI